MNHFKNSYQINVTILKLSILMRITRIKNYDFLKTHSIGHPIFNDIKYSAIIPKTRKFYTLENRRERIRESIISFWNHSHLL